MEALFVLAAIAGVPVLLALFFRVSVVFLFLSVAAGSLLATRVGDEVGSALSVLVRGQNTMLIAQFGLQLAPVVITLLLLRKTVSASRLPLHVLPHVATGLSLAVLTLPFLDSSAQTQLFAGQYGGTLRDSQDMVVGGATLMVLLLMFLTYRNKQDKSSKKHR